MVLRCYRVPLATFPQRSLFNTMAGAMSIPHDLREMARNLGVRGWPLWRSLMLPGMFAAWVTGGITASGGA